MPNLSLWTGMGHLGRDAELKVAGGSPLAEFSLAVTTKRKGDQSTAWYRCQLWGTRAEKLAPHLTKGKAVLVVGELVPREYKGRNDEMRTSLDVNVQTIQFVGGAGGTAGSGGDAGSTRAASDPAAAGGHYDDGDVPF